MKIHETPSRPYLIPSQMGQAIPPMSSTLQISIVLPIFQEGETVGDLIRLIADTLSREGLSFEIVAVDDGSRDNTFAVLERLRLEMPDCLRIAQHITNKGNGAALRTGIRLSRGEVVVCMDSDGQHKPEDILHLLEYIPPYDLVVGVRTRAYQGGWYRNFANRFYNRLASWLTQTEILDLTSGFRAVRRQAVSHVLHLLPTGFSAPTTITMSMLKAGYNVHFVPVDVLPRRQGKSKIRPLKDGWRFVMIIFKLITLYDPLRIFLPVAAFLGIIGLVTMAAGIWVAGRLVVPGSSVVLFIDAVIVTLLGLVSGQIANASVHYYGNEYITVYEGPIEETESVPGR